jgi:hypothetical protein
LLRALGTPQWNVAFLAIHMTFTSLDSDGTSLPHRRRCMSGNGSSNGHGARFSLVDTVGKLNCASSASAAHKTLDSTGCQPLPLSKSQSTLFRRNIVDPKLNETLDETEDSSIFFPVVFEENLDEATASPWDQETAIVPPRLLCVSPRAPWRRQRRQQRWSSRRGRGGDPSAYAHLSGGCGGGGGDGHSRQGVVGGNALDRPDRLHSSSSSSSSDGSGGSSNNGHSDNPDEMDVSLAATSRIRPVPIMDGAVAATAAAASSFDERHYTYSPVHSDLNLHEGFIIEIPAPVVVMEQPPQSTGTTRLHPTETTTTDSDTSRTDQHGADPMFEWDGYERPLVYQTSPHFQQQRRDRSTASVEPDIVNDRFHFVPVREERVPLPVVAPFREPKGRGRQGEWPDQEELPVRNFDRVRAASPPSSRYAWREDSDDMAGTSTKSCFLVPVVGNGRKKLESKLLQQQQQQLLYKPVPLRSGSSSAADTTTSGTTTTCNTSQSATSSTTLGHCKPSKSPESFGSGGGGRHWEPHADGARGPHSYNRNTPQRRREGPGGGWTYQDLLMARGVEPIVPTYDPPRRDEASSPMGFFWRTTPTSDGW